MILATSMYMAAGDSTPLNRPPLLSPRTPARQERREIHSPTTPIFPRRTELALLTALLRQRGVEFADEVGLGIFSGDGLTVDGIHYGVGVLRESLLASGYRSPDRSYVKSLDIISLDAVQGPALMELVHELHDNMKARARIGTAARAQLETSASSQNLQAPDLGKFTSGVIAGRKRQRQVVIDVDSWMPPLVVEDYDIVNDPVELGVRYARIALVEQPIKRLRSDGPLPPCEISKAYAVIEGLASASDAKSYILQALEANILNILHGIPADAWKCTKRANARPEGTKHSYQFVLGLQPSKGERFGAIPMPTPMTWKVPSLCTLLNLYLRIASPASTADDVSSIQVLRNFQSRPHVDGNNKGASWGLSFGDFVGKNSGIWVLDPNGTHRLKLRADVRYPRGKVIYEAGKSYSGKVLDTRRCPQRFDGNLLHYTMPVRSGTRYAVIFYCQNVANARTPGAMHAFLTALGFRLPSEAHLRALGQEGAFVDLALQGIAVKDEPYRAPLPSTRAAGGLPQDPVGFHTHSSVKTEPSD